MTPDDYLASAYIKLQNGDLEGATNDILSARELLETPNAP